MAKRMFSTDKRAEKILQYFRAKNDNVSEYISNAVVDETLPVYSQLRIEALYLLDFITDGAKDWNGNKLIIATDEDEVQFYIKQTLGRGIAWLGRNHHIKHCDVLKTIIDKYDMGPMSGENFNETVKEEIANVRKKLKEIDPDYNDYYIGLGSLARDVLDHWDKLWDWNNSYNLIMSLIYCEKPLAYMDPFDAIRWLQIMENQFIIEAIGEKTK